VRSRKIGTNEKMNGKDDWLVSKAQVVFSVVG
jgi:hypothetical protein